MTLDLRTIFILGAGALVYGAILPAKLRGWALMMTSVFAIYWLQPFLRVRRADFILPTLTIGLAVAGWWVTRRATEGNPAEGTIHRAPTESDTSGKPHPPAPSPYTGRGSNDTLNEKEIPSSDRRVSRLRLDAMKNWLNEDLIALVLIFGLIVGIAATRFLESDSQFTPSRPPNPAHVALALGAIGGVAGTIISLGKNRQRIPILTIAILVVIALFVILKTEPLATEAARLWRSRSGQDTALANMGDLAGWLGFSYIAFRLIHTFRDRQTGKLPDLSLREYVTYIIFFPAVTAGPIDRAERFIKDYRALPDLAGLAAPRFIEGTTRIGVGIFKKFVIADSLATGMALNTLNADQATSTLGLWALVYGYALRLFFDFSGYSDIAIGLGILFGIRLPENFDRPYLKNDLTSFWQSWHMTLSTWARFYVFTPLSRFLLTRSPKPSPTLVVFITQTATMIVIGLWHGVTWNFLIWGLWHGAGLFLHKQWSDRTRKWYLSLKAKPEQARAWKVFGWLVTFHYVTLGWVWFALPDVGQSIHVLGKLFGLH